MPKLRIFPVYVEDLRSDEFASSIDPACFGSYIRLLCHHWMEGSVPAERERIKRITGAVHGREFDRIWAVIGTKFVPSTSPTVSELRARCEAIGEQLRGNCIVNAKLLRLRCETIEKQLEQRKRAETRWSNRDPAYAAAHDPAYAIRNPLSVIRSDRTLSERKKRAPKRDSEPLPFTVDEALKTTAEASGGRIALSAADKGQSIATVKLIRKFPDLDTWRRVGEFLSGGGESWLNILGTGSLISRFADLEAKSRAPEFSDLNRGQVPVVDCPRTGSSWADGED